MADDRTKPTPEVVLPLYYSIPAGERSRSLELVNTMLAQAGYAPVPRSTLFRWAGKKKRATLPIEIARAAAIKLPTKAEAKKRESELADIPEALRHAIGDRMLLVAKGHGQDKVENAIVIVAEAIAARGPDIAAGLLDTEEESQTVKKDGETVTATTTKKAKAAQNAVQALAMLAESVKVIASARALQSVSFRNFAEGDQLSGMGENLRAEAETKRQAAAADGARNITPGHGGHDRVAGAGVTYSIDAEAADEAEAALADIETTR